MLSGFLWAKVINFSPLPMDSSINVYKQYQPMLQYLKKETGLEFKFVYSASYKELIANFISGKVDMIEAGALPYVKLKKKFPIAKPIVTFLNKNSKPFYTCQMITSDKNIKSLKDINSNTKIFLTRKLSTCGYLMSEYMLNKIDKSLKNSNYKYIGTHTDVVFNTTMYDDAVGGVSSKVAQKYTHLISIIDTSIKIPEFSLVVNSQTITPSQIKKIQNAFLSIKDKNKWNNNAKYGAIKTPTNFYHKITEITNKIKIPE